MDWAGFGLRQNSGKEIRLRARARDTHLFHEMERGVQRKDRNKYELRFVWSPVLSSSVWESITGSHFAALTFIE